MEIGSSKHHRSVPMQAQFNSLENVAFCNSKPSPDAGVKLFIYKPTGTFTDSTTKQQTSYKTKVNGKLCQKNFLVFLSFPPLGTHSYIRISLRRFPFSPVLRHESQCLSISPKHLVQWMVLFTVPSSFISFHWPAQPPKSIPAKYINSTYVSTRATGLAIKPN